MEEEDFELQLALQLSLQARVDLMHSACNLHALSYLGRLMIACLHKFDQLWSLLEFHILHSEGAGHASLFPYSGVCTWICT